MIILGLLPILSFYLIYRYIGSLVVQPGMPWRRIAFLQTAVIWGSLVLMSVEILSFFKGITFPFILSFWFVIATCFYILGTYHKANDFYVWTNWKSLTHLEKGICIALILEIVLVGLVASLATPNSWDAVNYHMSRVMFWEQNHSVAHYPTPEYRQIFFQPWGAFGMLHFQIMTQSDRFATLMSWFSYVGCAIGMSLVGAMLGGTRLQQLLMALAVVTIPTGIIEATGVRLDSIVSFWFVIFIAMIVLFVRTGNSVYVFYVGLSLGLGLLTKGTMYLIAAPAMAWFLYEACRRFEIKELIKMLFVVVLIVLVTNAGHYWRNFELSGHILGPDELRHWGLTEHMTPMLVVSNVIKNIFCQLGTPIHSWNTTIESFVLKMHQWFNLNITDPRSTYASWPFSTSVSTYEESVTNFVQVMLIIFAGAGLMFHSVRSKKWDVVVLFLCIIFSFVFISSTIKWNIHLCRYLLPTMTVSVALIFLWIGQAKWSKLIIPVIVIILVVTTSQYLFKNNLRRMVAKDKQTIFRTARTEMYFLNDLAYLPMYSNAVDLVAKQGCSQIGLYMQFNYWDYPFWILMGQKIKKPFRVEHINIAKTAPIQYPLGNFEPCAIISVDFSGDNIQWGNMKFAKNKDFKRLSVFFK